MKKILFLIIGLIFIFVLIYNVVGQNTTSTAAQFSLNDIQGKVISMSDYKGKVVILDFWATWCPPCREEIPDFIALQKKYSEKGLQIIGISLDRNRAESVKIFCEKMGINYPVLFSDGKVESEYGGIRAIPTTFIVDKGGRIIKKFVGFQPSTVFEEEIKKLL